MSQPMIRTYNSVSLQGKDIYEGRLQLYSFIQRNFLHEYQTIRNQPTEDASNSSRDATQKDVLQRNKFTGPKGVGGIGRARAPDAYINTRIGKGTGISLLTNAPQRLGRAGGPGSLVSAGGADEDMNSFSTSSLGIGRAGSPGNLVSAGGADEDTSTFSISSLGIGRAGSSGSLVSAGGAGENASSVSTANSFGLGRAGGSGNLISAGGAGENVSSVFTTNSSGVGRAGGPGCLVGVDGVVVSKDDVSHGIGWAGALVISFTSCLPGIQTILAKQYINSTKMKTEKVNVSLTLMEQPLKGDTENEIFLEAAVSTAFHHFLIKKIR